MTASAHAGHKIVPHDHSGQDGKRPPASWCSGRFCCLSCASKEDPRGVWFDGECCPPPKVKAAK